MYVETSLNNLDGALPISEISVEEVQRLEEENLRLRSLLIAHKIPIPEVTNLTGLRELSAPYDSLIEFLGIDEDLVEVAASASEPLKAGPSRKDLTAWIRGLTEKEKDGLLVSALSESDERWRIELLRRFGHENVTVSAHGAVERCTIADLLTASHARAEERMRKLNAQRAAEAARKKAKEEADRALFLDQLAKREKRPGNRWMRTFRSDSQMIMTGL